MDVTGSRDLKLWFSDGTNYPGQDDTIARQDRLAEALAEVYASASGRTQRFLLEYKLFEPAFYTMDVPDWGTAFAHCVALGPKAQVVIDTGHHAPGTNIEFIVAVLLRAGKLGGFDFNSRFYADDDLMVGSADPFQLFRIMWEVRRGGGLDPATGVAFMLDQCHNIEPKIAAQIRSVMNVQEATAKALLVDVDALGAAQSSGDVLAANAVFMDAYATDVRPMLGELRASMGLDPDPVARVPPLGLLRGDQRRARRRHAGRVGGVMDRPGPAVVGELIAALEPPRQRSPQHQLRRREHVGEGLGGRPGDRGRRRAALGQGLRRRPRHADPGRARRPAPRPGARPRRRVPRRRARGRDGRRVRLLPARQGRRGAVDRHGDACPRRCRPRRPPPPRLRHRPGDGRRRRGVDEGVLRRSRRLGAVAAPGLPARSRHRRHQGAQPGGDRRRPRRSRHHGVGQLERGVRGALAGDHPHGGRVPDRTGRPEPFGAVVPGHEPLPAGERRARAAALAPVTAGVGVHRSAPGRALHRRRRRARLLLAHRAGPAGGARHVVPRPLPADQGASARARRRGPPSPSTTPSPASESCTPAYRADYRAYYERHADAGLAADARRRSGDRARPRRRHVLLRGHEAGGAGRRRVLRQRHQRHARRRIGVDVRPDPGGGEVPHRVLGAGGGQAAAAAGAEAARRAGRPRHGRRFGHRAGRGPPAGRRGRVRRRRRPRRRGRRTPSPGSSDRPTSPCR